MMINLLYSSLAIGYGQMVILLLFAVPLLFLIRAIIRWLDRH